MNAAIYTIGHSNRSIEDLIALLQRHHVQRLMDIRAFPRSRRFPHFDRNPLSVSLAHDSIGYEWIGKDLGGYRKPRSDSPHTALRDASFRGFADYMTDERFLGAIEKLLAEANSRTTALMCAEANHHHCHRQFIADHLVLADYNIFHIGSDGSVEPHRLHGCLNSSQLPPIYNKHEQGDLFADV